MATIPDLPDGWIQRPGDAYASVPLDLVEGARVYAEPGWVEMRGEKFTVAEAEELHRRLGEAIGIAKAGRS